MLLIDAFFRFSGIGLLLFLIILIIRDLEKSPTSNYLLLSTISLLGTLLGNIPDEYHMPHLLKIFFRFLDIPSLVFYWLFALSLFKNNFKVNIYHVIIACFYCLLILAERLFQFNFINNIPKWHVYLISTTAIILISHTLFVTLKERPDDLIKERRKSRIHFVVIFSFITILLVATFYVLKFYKLLHYQATINIILLYPAILWVGLWLSDVSKNKFSFKKNSYIHSNKLNKLDEKLFKNLKHEMLINKAFLENKLMIDQLAKKLGVSSYRLREFINKTLGYDNFSTYINKFRIDVIKQALSNSDNNHIPILTIAMKNGFNSLPPFNRAFKNSEGITPSEYRKKVT